MKRLLLAAAALLALSFPALADPVGAGVNPGTAGTQSSMGGCVYRSGSITATNGQQMGVACDASGVLKVVNSGSPSGTQDVNVVAVGGNAVTTTVPVSGTVAATQSGTWNINNVAGTVSLPTGASTAALQTTGNTSLSTLAGTVTGANVNVVCTSGCSSTGGTSSTFGAAFPAAGTAVGFLNSAGTNMAAGNLDASGFLKVNVAAGSSGNAAASATGSAVPASGDYQAVNIGGTLRGQTGVNPSGVVYAGATDITSVNGITVLTGTGATGTGAQRVTVATDTATIAGSAPGTAGTASTNVVTVQGIAAGTPLIQNQTQVNSVAISTGAGATGTGTQRVGVAQDVTTIAGSAPGTAGTASTNVLTIQGVTSMTPVQVSQATASNLNATVTLAAGTALAGKVGIDQTTPGTTNGVSISHVGSTAVLTGGVNGSQGVGGLAANNATASGNPIQQSCLAISAEATLATAAQNASCVTDLAHKQIVMPYANPENFVSGTTAAMTATTSTSLIASPGASLRNYITQISCVNSHATVGTFVTVQDGSGGTALYTLAAGSVFGGSAYTFPVPLRQPTTATAIFVANVTTGANVICSATGYKGV